MKVTERTLVDKCRRINSEQIKQWDSGLKVERHSIEYVVMRIFRKFQKDRSSSHELFRGTPREVNAFIDGFANAADLVNNGAVSDLRVD